MLKRASSHPLNCPLSMQSLLAQRFSDLTVHMDHWDLGKMQTDSGSPPGGGWGARPHFEPGDLRAPGLESGLRGARF